MSENSFK